MIKSIHLRSTFPKYRIDLKGEPDAQGKIKSVGVAEFAGHIATVDAKFEAQLRRNPAYGTDFWIEDGASIAKVADANSPVDNTTDTKPPANKKPAEPDTKTDKDAGGESETGGAPVGDATGANGEGQAAKTPAPMTAAEKKAADKAAKDAAKAESDAKAKGNTKS